MGDKYALAYKNIDELNLVTPTSSDYLPVWDVSAGDWGKFTALGGAYTDISVSSLAGDGDANTKLVFTDDAISFQAGGVTFFDLTETTQDVATFNAGAVDIDWTFNKLTSGTWLNYNGGTDVLTLSGGSNIINGTMTFNNAAADVDTTFKKLTSGNWLAYDAGTDALTIGGATSSFVGNVTFADGTTDVDIASHDGTNGLKLGGVLVAATAVEINGPLDLSTRYVAAGSTIAVTSAAHNGKVIKLDTASGSVATLPAATGSGARFEFVISVLATSNSHVIKVANASDTMQGIILTMGDAPADCQAFAAIAGTSDTITLNRTTTGSVTVGERIVVEDFAANIWQVSGVTSSTGTEATPFSATV